ncbi:MAG: O-antigen ligase family protein [Hyphomicrobium sp.]
MSDWLLSLGIVLAASTQLSVGALEVGPGEILLVAWLIYVFARSAVSVPAATSFAVKQLIVFWSLFVTSLAIGAMVGMAIEPYFDVPGILHDIVAYSFILCLGIAMALVARERARRERLVWLVVVLGCGSLGLQLLQANGALPLNANIDPWFFDRLRGWSNDPNQLGFFCAVITLLAIHLADTAADFRWRVVAVAAALPGLVAGILSKSDSFNVAMVAAMCVFAVLKIVQWIGSADERTSVRARVVPLILSGLPVFALACLPFMPMALDRVQAHAEAMYYEDDQGDLRFALWKESLEQGLNSGLLGFGPGPHLTLKSYKRPPPAKFEAHNAPLHLFTQGGFIAVLALVWLYFQSFLATLSTRAAGLAALVCSLVVFGFFHFVLRHPVFWFGIVVSLLENTPAPVRLDIRSTLSARA